MKSSFRYAQCGVLITAGLVLLSFGSLAWGQVQPSLVVRANSRIVGYDPNKSYVYQICVGAGPEQLTPIGPPKLVGSGALAGVANGTVNILAATLGITNEMYVRVWFWEGGAFPRVDEAISAENPVAATTKYRILLQPGVGSYSLPLTQLTLRSYSSAEISAETDAINLGLLQVSTPIAFSADKRLIALVADDRIELFDLQKREMLRSYSSVGFIPGFLSLSHSSDFLLAVSPLQQKAVVWDAVSGKEAAIFTEGPFPFAFSSDDRFLLSHASDGADPVYELPDRTLPVSLTPAELGLRVRWPYGVLEFTDDLTNPWRELPTEQFSVDVLPAGTGYFRYRTGLGVSPSDPFANGGEWWQSVEAVLASRSIDSPPVVPSAIHLTPIKIDSESFLEFVNGDWAARITSWYDQAEAVFEATKKNLEENLAFDYRMADRFGLDKNGNDRMDLPNTKHYVHNVSPGELIPTEPQYDVTLIASISDRSRYHPWLERARAPTWLPGAYGARWELTPRNPPPLHPPQYVLSSEEREVTARLPAGMYDVALTVTYDGPLAAAFTFSHIINGEMHVKDWLIVAMGDSVTSGEGNPEFFTHSFETLWYLREPLTGVTVGQAVKRHKVWWADDGETANADASAWYGATPFSFTSTGSSFYSDYKWVDGLYNLYPHLKAGMSVVEKRHLQSHRSTVSWAAQLALALEKADSHSSVTFVSAAASGATMLNGVINPYDGIEHYWKWDPNGENWYAWEDSGYERTPLPAQLDEIVALLGRRTPDLMLMSIGANDAGFGQIAAALVADLCGSDLGGLVSDEEKFQRIEEAFLTGDFPRIMGSASCVLALNDIWEDVDGLSVLPFRLDGFASKLSQSFPSMAPERCLLIAYPRLFSKPDSEGYGVCDHALTDWVEFLVGGNGSKGIDASEMAWADERVLKPLNDTLRNAAAKHGWTFADRIPDLFLGHGICMQRESYSGNTGTYAYKPASQQSGMRWIRSGAEATEIQGPPRDSDTVVSTATTKGALHPTNSGHKAIKEEVLKIINRERLVVIE